VNDGQSTSALPLSSDVYLFCYCECVIDLYPEVADVLSIFVCPSRSCTARKLPVCR